MLEFLVFLIALAFIRATRRARPASPVYVEVHHYHHNVPGPGERRPMASNVVPFRRDAA